MTVVTKKQVWIIDSTVVGDRRINEKGKAEKYKEIASKCGKESCGSNSGLCSRYHIKRSVKILGHNRNEQDSSRTIW